MHLRLLERYANVLKGFFCETVSREKSQRTRPRDCYLSSKCRYQFVSLSGHSKLEFVDCEILRFIINSLEDLNVSLHENKLTHSYANIICIMKLHFIFCVVETFCILYVSSL